jgi:hypothetical protein
MMTDPITTLTIAAIADLAFRKFMESSATELAKKFTTDAIAKMDELRQKIWNKLRGQPTAETALTAIENRDWTEKDRLVAYLQVAMDNDPQFADEIRLLAQEIHAGKIQDNSAMIQNNYDNAKGYQVKVEGGTANIGDVRNYYGKSADSAEQ